MEYKFNVKEKSLHEFLKDRVVKETTSNGRQSISERNFIDAGNYTSESVSAYSLMKDEFLFKKDCGMEPGDYFRITLTDKSETQLSNLNNTYEYKIEAYDDICVKAILIDFKVSVSKVNKKFIN